MKILPINYNANKSNVKPSFNAKLHVSKSVKNIIEPNQKAFTKAAEMFDTWLRTEKNYVPKTLFIRENKSLVPRVAFEHIVSKWSYVYPHEETGHEVRELVKEYENLEFVMEDRACGFWFNEKSDENKLFSDFKNMFDYLNK